jgi:hypothetical protein
MWDVKNIFEILVFWHFFYPLVALLGQFYCYSRGMLFITINISFCQR